MAENKTKLFIFIGNGIGNQLYEYFAGYILAQKYHLELNIGMTYCHEKGIYYSIINDLNIPVSPTYLFNHYYNQHQNYAYRVQDLFPNKKIYTLKKNTDILFQNIGDDKEMYLKDESILKKFDVLVLGSQIYDNFCYRPYIDKIKQIITPKDSSQLLNIFPNELSKNPKIVAIHLRTHFFKNVEIASVDVLYAFISYFEKKLGSDCRFFVFSDCKRDAKIILKDRPHFYYVDRIGCGILGDFEELLCISLCKYQIFTSGSTYSIWARLLNTTPGAISLGKVYPLKIDVKVFFKNFFKKLRKKDYVNLGGMSKLRIKHYAKQYYKAPPIEKHRYPEIDMNTATPEAGLKWLEYIGLDLADSSGRKRNELLELKKNWLLERGDYSGAETILRKQYNDRYLETDFHLEYLDILKKNHKYTDAFVETMWINRNGKAFNEIKSYKTQRNHYIICFSDYYLCEMTDRMIELGIVLFKMGHTVDFIFEESKYRFQNEGEPEAAVQAINDGILKQTKRMLKENKNLTLCDEIKWPCKMYSLNCIEKSGTLPEFIKNITLSEMQNFLLYLTADPMIKPDEINNITKCCLNGMTWYDEERWGLLSAIDSVKAEKLIEHSDIVITRKENISKQLSDKYKDKIKYFENLIPPFWEKAEAGFTLNKQQCIDKNLIDLITIIESVQKD